MMNMSGFSSSPLPSSPQNAGDDRHEPSDGAASRSATEGAAPAIAAPEGRQPSIRERAFDAAQRLVLSQPFMAIGQLQQNRVADYILTMAGRFEEWITAQPPLDLRTMDTCMSGWDVAVDDACMARFDGSVYAWEGAPVCTTTHDEVVDLPPELPVAAQSRDASDPLINAYIESDRRVMALTDKLIDEQRRTFARISAVEGRIDSLLNRRRQRVL